MNPGQRLCLAVLFASLSASSRGEAPGAASPLPIPSATAEAPSSLAELLAQGTRYAEFRQFDLAFPLLEKAVETNPLDIEAQSTLGRARIEEVSEELLAAARLKALQ